MSCRNTVYLIIGKLLAQLISSSQSEMHFLIVHEKSELNYKDSLNKYDAFELGPV